MSDTERPTLTPGSRATIGEKYGYAMQVTDASEAASYFAALVEHNLSFGEHTREQAESTERANLGYYAGYYDNETRQRVERLFGCAHPIFGKATEPPVSPHVAVAAAIAVAAHV